MSDHPPLVTRHGHQCSLPSRDCRSKQSSKQEQARDMSSSKRDSHTGSDELEDAYEGFEDVGLAEDTKAGPSRHDSIDPWSPSEASTQTQQRSSLSTGYTSLDSPYDQPWASKDESYGSGSTAAYPPPRPSAFAPHVSTGSSTTGSPMTSYQPKVLDDIILGVAVVDFNHLVCWKVPS
jgi:hypothetical protein